MRRGKYICLGSTGTSEEAPWPCSAENNKSKREGIEKVCGHCIPHKYEHGICDRNEKDTRDRAHHNGCICRRIEP
jgi:hypothetical protein